jgi:hypothetical protein
MTELMELATGSIPSPDPEPSLIARYTPDGLRHFLKYVDNIFLGMKEVLAVVTIHGIGGRLL